MRHSFVVAFIAVFLSILVSHCSGNEDGCMHVACTRVVSVVMSIRILLKDLSEEKDNECERETIKSAHE